MVLRSMPQKHEPMTAILPLLGNLESQTVDVEVQSGLQVCHEQPYRSNLGDGEGPGQHDSLYVISGGKVRLVTKSRVDIDTFLAGLLYLCLLRHLREARLFVELAIVHVLGLAASQPTDLFDAIVQ